MGELEAADILEAIVGVNTPQLSVSQVGKLHILIGVSATNVGTENGQSLVWWTWANQLQPQRSTIVSKALAFRLNFSSVVAASSLA